MLPSVSAQNVVRGRAPFSAGTAPRWAAASVGGMGPPGNAAAQYRTRRALATGAIPRGPIRVSLQAKSRPASAADRVRSHRDLGADLDHPSGRDLIEVGGVARRLRQADEQVILPARHAGTRRRLERATRQEERG